MSHLRIPAVYMRGGTSKGVFFLGRDLPHGVADRERLLLRVIGSPDRYGRHTDGLGGGTSSTSKVVIVTPSLRDDCDVDFLFGAVAIDAPLIDWSGNCGNLSAAVGPFAISQGLDSSPSPVTLDPHTRARRRSERHDGSRGQPLSRLAWQGEAGRGAGWGRFAPFLSFLSLLSLG